YRLGPLEAALPQRYTQAHFRQPPALHWDIFGLAERVQAQRFPLQLFFGIEDQVVRYADTRIVAQLAVGLVPLLVRDDLDHHVGRLAILPQEVRAMIF